MAKWRGSASGKQQLCIRHGRWIQRLEPSGEIAKRECPVCKEREKVQTYTLDEGSDETEILVVDLDGGESVEIDITPQKEQR